MSRLPDTTALTLSNCTDTGHLLSIDFLSHGVYPDIQMLISRNRRVKTKPDILPKSNPAISLVRWSIHLHWFLYLLLSVSCVWSLWLWNCTFLPSFQFLEGHLPPGWTRYCYGSLIITLWNPQGSSRHPQNVWHHRFITFPGRVHTFTLLTKAFLLNIQRFEALRAQGNFHSMWL